MITLQQLITVAPFPEETKKELLAQQETLSDAKKLELEDMCWMLISQWYQNELQAKQEVAIQEMLRGQKQYTKEDIQKMGDTLFNELSTKLDVQASEEDLAQAREKLGVLLKEQKNNTN